MFCIPEAPAIRRCLSCARRGANAPASLGRMRAPRGSLARSKLLVLIFEESSRHLPKAPRVRDPEHFRVRVREQCFEPLVAHAARSRASFSSYVRAPVKLGFDRARACVVAAAVHSRIGSRLVRATPTRSSSLLERHSVRMIVWRWGILLPYVRHDAAQIINDQRLDAGHQSCSSHARRNRRSAT